MTRDSSMFSGLLLYVIVLGMSLCEGCSGGCGCEPDYLAELIEIQGTVERDWTDRLNQWTLAKQKDVFYTGDGVRAKKKSQAVLRLSEGSYVRLKAESMIRFLSSTKDSSISGVDLQEGEAEIEVGSNKLSLFTSIGLAELDTQSRLRIRRSKEGLDLFVKIGTAVLKMQKGEQAVIKTGEGIMIGIGTAILTRYVEKPTKKDKEPFLNPSSDIEDEQKPGDWVSIQVHGEGVRTQPSDESEWRVLSPGINQITPQSVLSLPKNTSVQVHRGQDKAQLFGEGKYKIGNPGSPLIQTRSGKVDLESTNNDLAVVVPGGVIITSGDVEESSRASIDVNEQDTWVSVQAGLVEILQEDQSKKLTAGQRIKLRNLKGKSKTITPKELMDKGPNYADFLVIAGESSVVHTANPPVAIEFTYPRECPSGGIVQLTGKKIRSSGTNYARLLLKRGKHRYTVRCITEQGIPNQKPIASGRITVVRDAGTRRLPRKAPLSLVDADGHTYTILYQNQLPLVNFRWQNPPKTSSYVLHVESPGKKTRVMKLNKPEHTFESGKLGDGTHRLYFQAGDSSRSSKTTSVKIIFNNAAPKISLSSPKEHSFQAGQEVLINGVAVPGWKIELIDGSISLDEHYRFTGKTTYTGKYKSIALRVTHPRRGTHYYLRRGQN